MASERVTENKANNEERVVWKKKELIRVKIKR